MLDILEYKIMNSPVGPLTLLATKKGLLGLNWGEDFWVGDEDLRHMAQKEQNHPILKIAEKQLKEYFRGKRFSFDISLDPRGTVFQKRAWQQLRQIPYGQVITYGEQARRLGRPQAARAVGAANGKNPIGIIVPCHRVVGASGHLTGFAGGLKIKRQLLELEGVQFKTKMKLY